MPELRIKKAFNEFVTLFLVLQERLLNFLAEMFLYIWVIFHSTNKKSHWIKNTIKALKMFFYIFVSIGCAVVVFHSHKPTGSINTLY